MGIEKKIHRLIKKHGALTEKITEIQGEIMDEFAKLGIDLEVVESYDDNVHYRQFVIDGYPLYYIADKIEAYLNNREGPEELRRFIPKSLDQKKLSKLLNLMRKMENIIIY